FVATQCARELLASPTLRSSDLLQEALLLALEEGDRDDEGDDQRHRHGRGGGPVAVGEELGPDHLAEHKRLRAAEQVGNHELADQDRKSTRLNSSHVKISYAVFC